MKHSIGRTITPATLTEIMQVPAGYVAEVDMLFVTNNTVSSKTIDVYWEHAHDPAHHIYILQQTPVNSKAYLQFSQGSVVFQAGDRLMATTEAASDFALIVTFDLRKEQPLYAFPNE